LPSVSTRPWAERSEAPKIVISSSSPDAMRRFCFALSGGVVEDEVGWVCAQQNAVATKKASGNARGKAFRKSLITA